MPIRIECPHCGRTGSAPDGSAGRSGKCPACGALFIINPSSAPISSSASPQSASVYPGVPLGTPAPQSAPSQTTVYVNQAQANDIGVAGFVLSLIGFLTCGCLSPLGLILSVAGLSREPRGLAIAGTVLGGLGSAWIVIIGLLVLLGMVSVPLAAR